MNPQSHLDRAEFDEADLGPKCACVLLLDTSSSMDGERIRALNEGLRTFQADLDRQDLVKYRVDVAVVTFGLGVEVAQEFISAADFEAAELSADGSTPMGEGIIKALDLVEQRKEHYRLQGNPVYRPWIFMITDGGPTDDYKKAAVRVKDAESRKSVAFWAIGVEGADMNTLAQISVRKPWKLRGLQFAELFQWLSNSLGKVSTSQPDEQTQLEPPSSDFTV